MEAKGYCKVRENVPRKVGFVLGFNKRKRCK